MQVAFDLVEQHDNARRRVFAEVACRESVFLPRPRENVRQGADAPYAGSGMENGDRSRVGGENGRDVPRVLDAQALNRIYFERVAACGR